MLVGELELILDQLAPFSSAETWDNVGLLVGRRSASVRRILVALEVTPDVVEEALAGDFQVLITHHPLIFSPLRRVTDGDSIGAMVQRLIAGNLALFALHTNLDTSQGGLCDIAALELGLGDVAPLVRRAAGWKKFVGFVPPESLEKVSGACFAAGAGIIGEYSECSFRLQGQGTFFGGEGASPAIGRAGRRETVEEVRFETVVPDRAVAAVVRAYLAAHPYEEPAFDIYPLENVLSRVGLGRVGTLRVTAPVRALGQTVADLLGLPDLVFFGDGDRLVDRVAVVTGSGSSLIEEAAGVAEVLVTGDLRHHDWQRAADLGLALILAPHFEFEQWALRQWVVTLAKKLEGRRVEISYSEAERSPWCKLPCVSGQVQRGQATGPLSPAGAEGPAPSEKLVVIRIDGGSRGNPGPSAIGVIIEDEDGRILEEVSACIGTQTNNVAEYQALITGLETALDRGARRVRVLSDSELLVKQMHREYRVLDPELKELYLEAVCLARRFDHFEIDHVPREENAAADALVKKALDGRV